MKRTYEKSLPEGYRTALTIDATQKKLGIILNVIAFLILAAIIVASALIIRPSGAVPLAVIFLAPLSIFLYIILHELVHGAAYKLLTGQKLSFGITPTVAFCGVPKIFVYRTTALIALLSPFIVFSVLFGLALFLITNPWYKMLFALLLGMHVGGCSGDLYNTFLYIFRFKSADTLMNDTGPKQTFYVKES